MTEVVILGGRGNGTVIASTIEDCKNAGQDIECVGFLNDDTNDPINGYPVLGKIENGDWKDLPEQYEFIFSITNVKENPERYEILQELTIPEQRYARIIHPDATVSNSATLERGVVVMPRAVVGPDVHLGPHTQLYAQSFIGHDTTLEDMVFVANNASVGGRLTVETGSHVGSNASLLERITVGEFAVIGLGTVVVDDVEPYHTVVGNPAESIGTI